MNLYHQQKIKSIAMKEFGLDIGFISENDEQLTKMYLWDGTSAGFEQMYLLHIRLLGEDYKIAYKELGLRMVTIEQ